MRGSARSQATRSLFQAAAQTYNHNLYWNSMKPGGGGPPRGTLATRIDADFGSYAAFRETAIRLALEHFSNGWVWLVLDQKKLRLVDTHDADTPLVKGQRPLLAMDVREHAYYLDYKNQRKEYATKFLDALWNWDCVERRLDVSP